MAADEMTLYDCRLGRPLEAASAAGMWWTRTLSLKDRRRLVPGLVATGCGRLLRLCCSCCCRLARSCWCCCCLVGSCRLFCEAIGLTALAMFKGGGATLGLGVRFSLIDGSLLASPLRLMCGCVGCGTLILTSLFCLLMLAC